MATTVQDAENLPFSRWAILAPLAVLLAFLWLTLMAFPHDDDVWFAWELRTRGLLGMLEAFYRELAGRFFANTVIVLPNMIADTLGLPLLSVYRATCALMLLATVATAYWAVGRLLETPPPTRAFLAGMLSCALIAGAPAPNDLYFWVSQIGNYTIAALVALVAMIRLFDEAPLSRVEIVALAVAGFLTAMATEMSGAILFVIVCGARRPYPLVLAAIAAGTLIVATAPANAVRMGVYGQSAGGALIAFPMAAVHECVFLAQRMATPAVLAWLIVLGLAARRPQADPWRPLLTALVAIYAAFWIGQLGLGQYLPPRARSHLHFVLVAGMSLTMVRLAPPVPRKLAVAALVLVLLTPHALGAFKSVLLDRPALQAAIDDRLQRLASAPRDADVVLPPFPVRGWPLVTSELPSDPAHWRNVGLARYYGVRSLRVQR